MMTMRTEPRLGFVPHFDVMTIGGGRIRYQDIWQRRALVLVLATPREHETTVEYGSQLEARRREFEEADSTIVVTEDAVPGLPPPRTVVADRWGEILHVEAPPSGDVRQLPSVDDLLSWVQFARIQCPECPP
jgi:hypothetical protein